MVNVEASAHHACPALATVMCCNSQLDLTARMVILTPGRLVMLAGLAVPWSMTALLDLHAIQSLEVWTLFMSVET